ncbi:cupin domain-containing protein, partial [Clostridium perfringens]
MENISKELLEKLVRQIIEEKLDGAVNNDSVDFIINKDKSGIMSIKLPTVKVDESNRLDTGNPIDVVYTKDLFTLEESPRLCAGLMEMKENTFDWTLNYDE